MAILCAWHVQVHKCSQASAAFVPDVYKWIVDCWRDSIQLQTLLHPSLITDIFVGLSRVFGGVLQLQWQNGIYAFMFKCMGLSSSREILPLGN